MNNLIIEKEEFGTCRTLVTDEKEVLFCLKDVCNILDVQVRDIRRRLDEGVVTTHPLSTRGGLQNLLFINEDGLYDTILESRKPSARAFRRWITREVLPSIARTGNYISNAEGAITEGFARLSEDEKEAKIGELTHQLELEQNKNKGFKQLESFQGGKTVTEISTLFGYSASAFNLLLNAFGIQRKVGETWIINSKYDNKGYTSYRHLLIHHSNGETEQKRTMTWTEKGIDFLVEFLNKKGIHMKFEQVE